MASEYKTSQRIALAVVPLLASAVIRLLGCTLRFEDICEPGVRPGLEVPPPGIFVFWHRSLLMAAYRFRNQGIAILISRSFDGELIARTVELLGFVAVRGSSSRGGASGLRAMEQAYRDGRRVAITSDGPRGPVFVTKPGAVQLAQLTNSFIGSFYLLPQRAWELTSWDRFLIPKPFSRVVVTWAPHAEFSNDSEVMQAQLQAAQDRTVARAESHWGVRL